MANQSEAQPGAEPTLTALEAALVALGVFFLGAWLMSVTGASAGLTLRGWLWAQHLPPLVMLAAGGVVAWRYRPLVPVAHSFSTLLFALGGLFAGLIAGTLPGHTRPDIIAPLLQPGSALVWAIVWVGLAAPVIEEFFFRGVLQAAAARRMHPLLALGLSSGAFTIAHLGAHGIWLYLALGLAFGALALLSGSIIPGIAAHIGWNLGTIVLAGLRPHQLVAWELLLPLGVALCLVACILRAREVRRR